jgi:hypothetical protein
MASSRHHVDDTQATMPTQASSLGTMAHNAGHGAMNHNAGHGADPQLGPKTKLRHLGV